MGRKVSEFNKSAKMGKNENPRKFAERLEHIAKSLDDFHGVHKTDAEIIDQILCAVEETGILADTEKCIRRERKRSTHMNLVLV